MENNQKNRIAAIIMIIIIIVGVIVVFKSTTISWLKPGNTTPVITKKDSLSLAIKSQATKDSLSLALKSQTAKDSLLLVSKGQATKDSLSLALKSQTAKDSILLSSMTGQILNLKKNLKKDSLNLVLKDQIIKNLSRRSVHLTVKLPAPALRPAPAITSAPTPSPIKRGEKAIAPAVALPVFFSVLTDQGYWPDWARKNKNFPEIVKNGQGGYNLKIEKFSNYRGTYGITASGTIFIKTSEFDHPDQIQVISNISSWKLQSMKKVTNSSGSFYTWTKTKK